MYQIEKSLKEIIFEIRPDYKDNAVANVTITYSIYGGFYAFEKCRRFGDSEVIDIMADLNKKVNELLN
ncbi:MAG: hypothetical protein NC393_14785 [Clostridium sp.]|nr:hypothetical protein [Clostridium sp.]MCM1173374.1 hypothetical protein [Clostridium sp.]MCM1207568.1 hypothetical protein [Ruminococcus sp.]